MSAPEIEIEIAPVVPRKRARRISDRLRLEAQMLYVYDIEGISLEDLHTDPRFETSVSIETFRIWSREEGWVARREKWLKTLQENVEKKLRKRLFSEMAQVRIRQLEQTQQILNSLFEKAMSADVKSAEGAAKVLIEVMRHERDLVQSVRGEIPGLVDSTGEGNGIMPRSDATDQEVDSAIKLILEGRRNAARQITAEAEPLPAPTKEGSDGS